MLLKYNSVLNPSIGHEFKDGGMLEIEPETLEYYIEKQRDIEERLKNLRENEPPRKRKNKSAYKAWIDLTQDYLDELREVRVKIELIKNQ